MFNARSLLQITDIMYHRLWSCLKECRTTPSHFFMNDCFGRVAISKRTIIRHFRPPLGIEVDNDAIGPVA